ncbi:MAG TPA: CAP domain-containing protein [Acidimicrobiales bacterium]|nr:CAP domain-containing protein [Acidimicrobiales bacterium]
MAVGLVIVVLGIGGAAAGGTASEPCLFETLVTCPGAGAPPTTTTTEPPPPTTTTTARPAMTAEEAASRLLAKVNEERVSAALPVLVPRDDVSAIAKDWSASMARAGALSHNDAYFARGTRERLQARALGENVARAPSVDEAHRALMASAGHRANILDGRFKVIGIGAVRSGGSWWLTQNFVEPRPAAAADAGERTRDGGAVHPAGDDPGEPAVAAPSAVRAAAAPNASAAVEPVGLAPAAQSPSGPAIAQLASQPPTHRRLGLVVLAAALPLVVLAAAARSRRVAPGDVLAEPTVVPTALTVAEGSEVAEPRSTPSEELRHCVSVLSAWVSTLDDSWANLSDGDRRVAMQSIRRNVEAAAGLVAVPAS